MTHRLEERLRLDLHLHTVGSRDCLSPPEAVLARAAQEGIHRVAITDHNRLQVALKMYERYPDRVIPGEEIRTGEGMDLIGLYLKTEIPKGTSAVEAARRIRDQGGIVYLPHPFASGKGQSGRYVEDIIEWVDVVEVFNARLHPGKLNRPAEELARAHEKLRGAGSDAHSLGEIGGAWVEVPPHENESGALLRALDESRVTGRTAPIWVHLASTWAKLVRLRSGGGAPWEGEAEA